MKSTQNAIDRASKHLNPKIKFDFSLILANSPCDIDQKANETKALQRKRKIRDAETLLRLGLIWAISGDMSIRTTTAWAEEALGLSMSDTALTNRFCKMEEFVTSLIQSYCEQTEQRSNPSKALFRLVDATTFCVPGSCGTDYRWHVEYDPETAQVTSCSLTDNKGAEHFERTNVINLEVLMGDCYYGKASQIHAAHERHCGCLCRAYLPHIKLFNVKGERLDVKRLRNMKILPQEIEVRIPWKEKILNARLFIVPLPPKQMAKARVKARKKAKKRGKGVTHETLWLVSHWFLISTLNCDLITPQVAVDMYRLRWQVELFFKRAKSLLELATIDKARKVMERVQILLRILYVFILQQFLVPDWNRWRKRMDVRGKYHAMPASLWRQSVLLNKKLISILFGPVSRVELSQRERDRLAERPRRRRYACETLGVFREAIVEKYQNKQINTQLQLP